MTLQEKMQSISDNLGELYPIPNSTSTFYKILSELIAKPYMSIDNNIEYLSGVISGHNISEAEFNDYWSKIIGVKNKKVTLGEINACTLKGFTHMIASQLEIPSACTVTTTNTTCTIATSVSPSGNNIIFHSIQVVDAMASGGTAGNVTINLDLHVPTGLAIQEAVVKASYTKLILSIVSDACVGIGKDINVTITRF